MVVDNEYSKVQISGGKSITYTGAHSTQTIMSADRPSDEEIYGRMTPISTQSI